MKILTAFLLACAALSSAQAATYVSEAPFSVTGSTIAGMDQDAVGNLYVLARVPGTTTSYTVSSYQPQSLTPEFSFGVTITTPLAFAVEANGVIDILDAGNALTLTRWDNSGNQISQVARISPYMTSYYVGAFDKVNSLFYLSYPAAVTQETGDFSVKILYYQGAVAQYSFTGALQTVFDLPGQSSISTTCYTPSMMSVDTQGTLWVTDPVCKQLLSYNSSGTLGKDFTLPAAYLPKSMWLGPGGSTFITNSVCDANGCPHGLLTELNSSGVQQNTLLTSSLTGEAWDARTLYLAAASGGTLQQYLLDNAPSVPVPTAPQSITPQHSALASMSWQASTDPDGDPLVYAVYIGTNSSQLVFAGSTTATSFVSSPLAFSTNYFWQVTAQDSYLNVPILTSTGAVVGFDLKFVNSPPGAFSVTGGTGTAFTRSTSVTFGWTAAIDPDGDPVTYTVSWQAVGQSSATATTTTANSLSVGGLSFGTTVSWSVVACDPYAACTPMTGGTQSYVPVFKNSPPSMPAITGGTGVIAEHTLSPWATISWSTATDPDGDLVSYQAEIGTSAENLALVQLGAATSDFLPSLAFNTTYYWAAAAFDPYGAASTTTLQSFLVVLQNNPPGTFSAVSGTGTLTTRTTAQFLTWSTSTDPDGDLVTYGLSLGTSPAGLAVVQISTATSYPLTIQYGTTYYWNVSAFDGFGGTTTITGGEQVFSPVFLYGAPPAPAILGGTGVIAEHTLSPSIGLSWSSVADPEGDPISYSLAFGTSAASQNTYQLGTSTSDVLSGLSFGATYFWTVTANNPYGGASTSTLQSVSIALQNNPPGPFAIAGGTGTLSARTTSQLLAWGVSTDPDGDAVTYSLSVSTWPAGLAVVQTSSTTSYALNFQYGTTYYWSVSAFDGFGGTTTISGGTQSFLATFLNPAPQVVQLAPQLLITTMRGIATVSWQQVTTPEGDPVSYTVDFGDSLANLQPFVQIDPAPAAGATAQSVRVLGSTPLAQTQIAGSTVTLTMTGLDYYHTYYLNIQAADPYGAMSVSPVQTFTLGTENGFPSAYNYPNPFSPIQGGTNIVFNAPPSGYAKATVEVYSEWQALLFKQDYFNIPPGVSQVPFSGRDRFGRPFFNGSYICRVRFSGPDDRAIFYLLVVK